MKIGFAGAGSMAAAMARGWAGAETGPESMAFADSGSGRAAALAGQLGGEARPLSELQASCDLVVLAVKPGALDAVAPDLIGARCVVSVLGATPVARLREALGETPVLRAMPNLAVEVRRGVICHVPPGEIPADLSASALSMLSALGSVIELEEDLLDAATAIMGCSPAYLARAAEVLIEAGEREGIDHALAARLVAEAVAGTGELLADHEAAEIVAAVASPGGSTEAGLMAIDGYDGDAALRAAVEASLERMRG